MPGTVALRARSEPALLLASLAWAAAIMHAVACAQHVHESPPAAAAFAVLTVVQVGLGAWLWSRPDPRALAAAAASSAAVVAVWAASRTIGVPPGHVEQAGVLDATATALEVLLVAGAAAGARGAAHVVLQPALIRAVLITSLAAVMLAGGHAH
jgi:hypothetical protein